jgi:hypothetical protein
MQMPVYEPRRARRRRIDLREDYEIAYWCKKFGVTEEELASAVLRVGSRAKDVEDELKSHPRN